MRRETTQKRAETIKKLLSDGYTVPDLASIFGLSEQSIWRIKYAVDNKKENGLNNNQDVPLERVA